MHLFIDEVRLFTQQLLVVIKQSVMFVFLIEKKNNKIGSCINNKNECFINRYTICRSLAEIKKQNL
jgi:hypothetical protein